jgi:hypothetical protein
MASRQRLSSQLLEHSEIHRLTLSICPIGITHRIEIILRGRVSCKLREGEKNRRNAIQSHKPRGGGFLCRMRDHSHQPRGR